MSEAAGASSLSCDDDLALERETPTRYGWWQGSVYALAGGTPAHAMLGSAIGAELRSLARADPFQGRPRGRAWASTPSPHGC